VTDSNTKADVRRLFLANPEVELTKTDVAARVVVRRGPSAFALPEKCAADALKALVFDGYLTVRKARMNFYKRDLADPRPALPEGYFYERAHGQNGIVDWIETPRFGANGPIRLYLEGTEAASCNVFYDMTARTQAKPLTEQSARAYLERLAGFGLRLEGRNLLARIDDVHALNRLADLVSRSSYDGARIAA